MIAPQNNTTPVMRSSLISNDLITLAATPSSSSSSSSSSVVTIKNYLRDGIQGVHVMKYGNITCLLLNCIIILYIVVDSTVCIKHVDSAV